ncbi:MAG: hypothetical protein LH609_11900 [Rudanella sp.]|nr:hypothetical protein [Rudanella sp.]
MVRSLRCLCATLLLSLFVASPSIAQKTPEITIEKIAEKCKGLPRDKRVVVKVARFNVSARSAQANATFGDELATMRGRLPGGLPQREWHEVSIEHTGNTDELIDVLGKNPAIKFEVTALEDGKAGITLN